MTQPCYKILLAPSPPSPKNPRRRTTIQAETSTLNSQQKESLGHPKRKRSAPQDTQDPPLETHPKRSEASDPAKMASTFSTVLDSIVTSDQIKSLEDDGSLNELAHNDEESDASYQDGNSIENGQDHLGDEDEEEEVDDEESEPKYSLHIEVRLRTNSTILYDTVHNAIGRYINDNFTALQTEAPVPGWQDLKFLVDQVYSVYCAECAHPLSLVPIRSANLHIHVYELPDEGEDQITMLCANPVDSSELGHDTHENEDEPSGDVAASKIQLPANRLEGVWECLIYENGLKTKLLNYIYSSIVFAEQNVNQNLIAWHRLVLLHGPPGTGKTSLCRALAQKVSIRLSGIYQRTELVEINSHSLFSKWFSESGKLVHSLFNKIEQIAEDSDVFVLVLIDEVESLAGCRSSGASGGEPSDALRAVNSLLTALDKLRHYKNVLVLTTSNLTASIDDAFLDRADIKQFIPLPSPEAIYWILQTSLRELIETKILTPRRFLDHKEAMMARDAMADQSKTQSKSNDQEQGGSLFVAPGGMSKSDGQLKSSMKLLEISEAACGMSGRSLRRLPLLAHARTSVGCCSRRESKVRLNMDVYLKSMLEVAMELRCASS